MRERFARIEIQASKPIVPFRETAVKAPGMIYILLGFSRSPHALEPDMAPPKTPNAARGTIRGASSQNSVSFTIRTVPLPEIIHEFILQNLTTISDLLQDHRADDAGGGTSELERGGVQGDVVQTPSVKPEQFWAALEAKCKEAGSEWLGVGERIWAFGPHNAGGCLLIDARKDTVPRSYVYLCPPFGWK